MAIKVGVPGELRAGRAGRVRAGRGLNLPHPTPFSLNSCPLAASPGIHQGIPLVPQKREIQGEGGEWVVHNSRYTSAHFHNREQRPGANLTVDHQELPNLNTGQSRPALGSGHVVPDASFSPSPSAMQAASEQRENAWASTFPQAASIQTLLSFLWKVQGERGFPAPALKKSV